jgi:hypothetical protein
VRKKGHWRLISSSTLFWPSSMACCSPLWAPSQAGSISRFWVQAKIQGMARRLSTPPLGLRLAGREPSGSLPSSISGVAARK